MSDKQARKLIALDCDGTLFGGDGYPSVQSCNMVEQVVSEGHHVVAVTGRSRLSASDRLASVPGMRYLVCSNGAYTWDRQDDVLVWEAPLRQQLVADITSRMREAFTDISFGWETRTGIGFEEDFIRLAGGIGELESGGLAGDPWSQDLYKLYARRPSVFRVELQREVSALLGEGQGEISTSGVPFIEITAPDAHKASGLEKMSAMLGFTAADTIVFGDNNNDLPMFRWAGHAVAMDNALDDVKACAHAVTLSNTEHGVAHYLEKLLRTGIL